MFIEVLFIMAEKLAKPQTFIRTLIETIEISDFYSNIDKTTHYTVQKKQLNRKSACYVISPM